MSILTGAPARRELKRAIGLTTLVVATLSVFVSGAYAAPPSFEGAVPDPAGLSRGPISQLKIRFPKEMVKQANKEIFNVSCSPEVHGFSGWADNNTLWTYDFKAKTENDSPRLAGGTKCQITQPGELKSTDGKTWKAGSIHYDIVADGPNVTSINPAHGFQGNLRETDPIVLITFDGPVDRSQFFADQSGVLAYLSSNAPSEKLALEPVPADQTEQIFKLFKSTGYYDVQYSDQTWILATVKQSLIPGADVKVSVNHQRSAANADVRASIAFEKELTVRSNFKVDIACASPSATAGVCMPKSPITATLNGMVKWADIQGAYIEYVPFKSNDKKVVRTFAGIEKDRKLPYWDQMINDLSYYFPFLAKYSDTVVDSVVFDVDIEPQTQAKVVLPSGMKDLDGRVLSNVISEFHIRIGAMDEEIQIVHQLSIFEKNVPDLFLPIGIVNLNQRLLIRKSGTDAKVWEPIQDPVSMIKLVRAYAERGNYREQAQYVSPMELTSLPSTVVDEALSGDKNRMNVLQFPFAAPGGQRKSGLYAIEVSSPTFEEKQSDAKSDRYYNPKYSLAQVTNLTVHIKSGTKSNLAWVTRLSDASVVAGAQLEVYNCNGEKVTSVTTDKAGLAHFPVSEYAKDCGSTTETYSPYLQPTEFYAVAKTGDDIAVVHSSWVSEGSYALGAPGVEYFYSSIKEDAPYYHALIGVNLVKPGQTVPVEIIAKIPRAKGFSEIAKADLPETARMVSNDDADTYYEFPLKWENGKAVLNWEVPADSSVRLGTYALQINGNPIPMGDVDVAEFKIPLMSGLISFPNIDLIRPDSIPLGVGIRYANGVGAKNLKTDLSYYFSSTTISSEKLPKFAFGTGPMRNEGAESNGENKNLPSGLRPSVISSVTKPDGSLVSDLATEKASDGRTIAEVLKGVDRPQLMVARIRYQDQVGEFQTLSQSKVVFNSEIYVGTNIVPGARTEGRLQVAVIDVKKKNITNLSDLDLKLVRVESKVIGEEVFGGLIKNTLERELKPVRWTPNCSMQNAVVSCPVGALKEGTYAFEATSKASKQAAHSLFKVDGDGRIYGQDQYSGFGDDESPKQLPLVLNKEQYSNGERAVVSFTAPFKTCNALVTIERSDVMETFISPDACQKGHVEINVDDALAPNAFVSVYAITGRADASSLKLGDVDLGRPTYRLGFANLKVNWAHYKSDVTVKTEKPKYEPGEQVNVSVQVLPEEGKLQGGTVTLVALEEKILELKPNETYKVLNALMDLRTHSVSTITALERIDTVAGKNPEGDKSSRKGGDEGGDGSSKSDFKRKLFNALVTFQPGVPVVDGVAKFSFKTNDSLTKFRIFAVATDLAQKFGTGEAQYLTEKDTQAYSNIPSVAHVGDKYPLRVTVQNNSGSDTEYKIDVTAVSKDRNGNVISTKKMTKSQKIGKSESPSVDVGGVEISDQASRIEYVVNVYDKNGKLVDSMTPEAQVVLPTVPLSIHDSFINQLENGSLAKTIVKDAAALADQGEIRISTSKSLVSSALTQIGQRIDRSLFTELFIESRFQAALLHSSEQKPEAIKKVLESLLGFVDAKGFVKYYPQATRGSVHLTAEILHSLQLEPWAAKLLPASLQSKMKEAVSSVLTKSVESDYIGSSKMDWLEAQVTMARAAFIFGDQLLSESAVAVNTTIDAELKRDPKAYGPTIETWSNDVLVEKWLLEVFAAPKRATKTAARDLLVKRLIYAGNQAQLTGSPVYRNWYSDETIETAKMLLAQSILKGENNLARALGVGLANANVKGWYNLSTMAHVAEGLKRFGRSYETEAVTGTALLSIPEEQKSAAVDFDKVQSGSLVSDWKARTATLNIKHGGSGQPWVSVQALSAVPLTAARGQGLAIEKTAKNLTRDFSLDGSKESASAAGDIIEVTLTINANSMLRHMAIVDPIPAGANILSDAYGDFSSGQKSYAGYRLYFEKLPLGSTVVKYQYQLNNPGTFQLPPTRAEGLYMPSLFAETPNASVTVQ